MLNYKSFAEGCKVEKFATKNAKSYQKMIIDNIVVVEFLFEFLSL